jgi:Lrp/AsnC family leucine-responsive transcriptional regulator
MRRIGQKSCIAKPPEWYDIATKVPKTVDIQNKNKRSGSTRKQPLDDLDRRLLALLQEDGRRPTATLARTLKLSGPGLQKRLRKLEERGVILRYAAIVDREAVGLDLLCFIHVMLAHHRPDSVKRFPDRVRSLREVLECHYLTGEFDYLLKVVVANHDELERFLFERLMKVPGVDRTRTSIVVKEVKATTALPI